MICTAKQLRLIGTTHAQKAMSECLHPVLKDSLQWPTKDMISQVRDTLSPLAAVSMQKRGYKRIPAPYLEAYWDELDKFTVEDRYGVEFFYPWNYIPPSLSEELTR